MSGSLRDILQALYTQNGELTPASVVAVARDEAHPLHSRFEWDDAVAGEEWRYQQAADLIRSVKIVYREATESEAARSVRAFQAVRTPRGNSYKPVDEIAGDPIARQIVIADMEREWKALYRRYAQFQEFVAMIQADLQENAAA